MGRERPSQGVPRDCKVRHPTVPIREAKTGGRLSCSILGYGRLICRSGSRGRPGLLRTRKGERLVGGEPRPELSLNEDTFPATLTEADEVRSLALLTGSLGAYSGYLPNRRATDGQDGRKSTPRRLGFRKDVCERFNRNVLGGREHRDDLGQQRLAPLGGDRQKCSSL